MTKEEIIERVSSYEIYMHKNIRTNKIYIGKSRAGWQKRWWSWFSRATQRYGEKEIGKSTEWGHIVLAYASTPEEAKRLETEMIDKYDATNPDIGYNKSKGEGSLGMKYKERVINPDARRIMSENQSALMKAYWESHPEKRAKPKEKKIINRKKAVDLYTINGDFVKRFESIESCAEFLGTNPRSAGDCLHQRRRTIKGHVIIFAEGKYKEPEDKRHANKGRPKKNS